MARLFGTDGVRGIANTELTCKMAFLLGRAGAQVLTGEKERPRILIGRDTRISGSMLESALVAGICSTGATAYIVGVIPTPGIAYLTRDLHMDAGIVISASHNPVEYNGIKFFNAEGYKLSDELEDQIQANMEQPPLQLPSGADVGQRIELPEAETLYLDYLLAMAQQRFDGLRIALDCANGASSAFGAKLFSQLGAEVVTIGHQPDGVNINDNCGSTHPEGLQKLVADSKADIGLAFDGDADRLIAVDEKGNLIDGDVIMGLCAIDLKERGLLKQDTLVVTVMSNLGLELSLQEVGIQLYKTAVGDRYVCEAMQAHGFNLGGEQSGHVIFSDLSTSGDGMLSGMQLASVLVRSKQKLSDLAGQIKVLAQVLVNAHVNAQRKNEYLEEPAIAAMVADMESFYAGKGRVLIRPSGTEHLIRVMIESDDLEDMKAKAKALADLMEAKLG